MSLEWIEVGVLLKHAQILGLMDVGLEGAALVREESQRRFEVVEWVWLKGQVMENEMLELDLVLGRG